MKTIAWKPRGSMSQHKTVKEWALAEEHTTKDPAPGFETLKPGESRRVIHDDSVQIKGTNNDRLTFSSGASIEEHSSESGLSESGVLTRKAPDGSESVVDGGHAYIDYDADADDFQPAIFFNVQDQFGDYNLWKQSFPKEGGMTLTPPDSDDGLGLCSFQLSPDGKLTAEYRNYEFETEKMEARQVGDALVARDGKFEFGIAPPVPMDWLMPGEGNR